MDKTVNTSALTFKDIVTLILSIAAFILSIMNFYFTNYRIEDNLQARVTNTEIVGRFSDSTKCDTAIVQVAFVNGGNRQAIVLAPWFQLADTTNTINGAWGGNIDNSDAFPIILQAHEMRIVGIKLSAKTLTLNPGKVSKDDPSMFEYFLAIEYFSLDSKAKKHDVWGKFNVHIYAKGNEINAIIPPNDLNKTISTDLFSDKETGKSVIAINADK